MQSTYDTDTIATDVSIDDTTDSGVLAVESEPPIVTDGDPVGIAYVFIGFPGAGKSTAADYAHRILGDSIIVRTGDIVRSMAAEFHEMPIDDLTGEEIGKFSTFMRENDSPLYVAREVKRRLDRNPMWPQSPVVLDGVRDSEAAEFYRSFIDAFRVIFVHAPFEERVYRLRERGREEDEETFTADDLMDRERRECGWGMDTFPDQADQVIMNTGTIEVLREKVVAALLGAP